MKHHSRILPVLAVTLLASCGDKPELVKKSAEQEVEIARLRGELAVIEEKLKNVPADRSAELTEARQAAEAQAAEITRLEAEVASLQTRKASLKKEYEEYQRKYAIR